MSTSMRMAEGSRRRFRLARGVAALAAVSLIASACGSDSKSASGTGSGSESSGTADAVIARGMDVNSLDPSLSYCDTCQIFIDRVRNPDRSRPTDNQTLIPRLATKWEGNADQTEFTFNLDPKAKFPDGTAVTSTDVKFSWERLR